MAARLTATLGVSRRVVNFRGGVVTVPLLLVVPGAWHKPDTFAVWSTNYRISTCSPFKGPPIFASLDLPWRRVRPYPDG
jgi:hypothetical protein